MRSAASTNGERSGRKQHKMQKFSLTKTVGIDDPGTACDFLVKHTGLSKSRIKDAMNKGAVWIRGERGKQYRIRRATAALKTGDYLSIYHDDKLLALAPLRPECLGDQSRYSVWFKPAGLMAQGTKYGDHCSLLRQAELFFKSKRKVFPVHRLDREASGIVLIAHDKTAAGRLSRLFQSQLVIKRYRARVLGNLAAQRPRGKIDRPLEGKPALTEFAVTGYDPASDISSVDIILHTGRKHQIRRHFEAIGFPVMGDPRYGKGNKNNSGLKLMATTLEFHCPFEKKDRVFESPHTGFNAGAD
jgi:tRNA pseudouridine32 synthase/23S rRNA pseudouridine746 synthase